MTLSQESVSVTKSKRSRKVSFLFLWYRTRTYWLLLYLFICRLHEAFPEHKRAAHGARAQIHPRQLDERVQEMVPHSPGSLSHWYVL
jgi:hypothetical protein